MCSRQRTCQKKRNTWQTVWNTNFTWKGSSQFPEMSQLFWHGICSALEYGQEIARPMPKRWGFPALLQEVWWCLVPVTPSGYVLHTSRCTSTSPVELPVLQAIHCRAPLRTPLACARSGNTSRQRQRPPNLRKKYLESQPPDPPVIQHCHEKKRTLTHTDPQVSWRNHLQMDPLRIFPCPWGPWDDLCWCSVQWIRVQLPSFPTKQ